MLSVTKARSLGIIFDPFSIVPSNPSSSPVGLISKIYLKFNYSQLYCHHPNPSHHHVYCNRLLDGFPFPPQSILHPQLREPFSKKAYVIFISYCSPPPSPESILLVFFTVLWCVLPLSCFKAFAYTVPIAWNAFTRKSIHSKAGSFSSFSLFSILFHHHQPSHPLCFSKAASWFCFSHHSSQWWSRWFVGLSVERPSPSLVCGIHEGRDLFCSPYISCCLLSNEEIRCLLNERKNEGKPK